MYTRNKQSGPAVLRAQGRCFKLDGGLCFLNAILFLPCVLLPASNYVRWWLRCRLSNRGVSLICVQSAAAASAASAAVRHCVPDGKKCCLFIESDHSVFFLFVQTRYIFYVRVPLGSTVAFAASIYIWYDQISSFFLKPSPWSQNRLQ